MAQNDQNCMKHGENWFLENFQKIFHLKIFLGLRKFSKNFQKIEKNFLAKVDQNYLKHGENWFL